MKFTRIIECFCGIGLLAYAIIRMINWAEYRFGDAPIIPFGSVDIIVLIMLTVQLSSDLILPKDKNYD